MIGYDQLSFSFLLAIATLNVFALQSCTASDEQDIIQNLVANRHLIHRNVTETENGIVASTWSLEDNVSGWIKTHVQQMKALMDSDAGVIRQWDDLFREAFALRDYHRMDVKYTDEGVEVEQIGDNDCAVAIVQAHAAVVSLFIERGQAETRLNHEVPEQCSEDEGSTSSSTVLAGVHRFVLLGVLFVCVGLFR